jgi:Peptidase family M28
MLNQRAMIEADTRALALPQGRMVGDPGHDAALAYLENRLLEIGLTPFKGNGFRLEFQRQGIHFTNLAGIVRGADSSRPPLLVGAHYDSALSGPSADDNATAVAVTLASAARFQAAPLHRDLIVTLFDSEEPPYYLGEAMGSKRFYQDHCRDIQFGLCLIMDLIGHDVELPGSLGELIPSASDLLAVTGCESHPALPSVLSAAIGREQGLKVLPLPNSRVGDMSDHHAFRLGGEPYLFLSCGEGKYYHRMEDDLDWINFEKVEKVERLVAALMSEADRQLPGAHQNRGEFPRQPAIHDTTELEITQIESIFGEHLPKLLAHCGLGPKLARVEQVDQFHAYLASLVRGRG